MSSIFRLYRNRYNCLLITLNLENVAASQQVELKFFGDVCWNEGATPNFIVNQCRKLLPQS